MSLHAAQKLRIGYPSGKLQFAGKLCPIPMSFFRKHHKAGDIKIVCNRQAPHIIPASGKFYWSRADRYQGNAVFRLSADIADKAFRYASGLGVGMGGDLRGGLKPVF